MANTNRIPADPGADPNPRAPKTRDEIVEESHQRVSVSNSREKLAMDSAAANGTSQDRDPNEARVSEFEELTKRSSNNPPNGYARFVAYGLLAFGILVMGFLFVRVLL
ncbi:MAG: hypothetical protein ACU0GG_04705 [Paracoccaceae bacterium]